MTRHFGTHWDPYSDYGPGGEEIPRRTHRDLEPVRHRKFGYPGPRPEPDDYYDGPDDAYSGSEMDERADEAADRYYGGSL